MTTLIGTGVHRLVYKSVGFATGLTVTAYIWSPALVKSDLQTFTEVSDGLYYLDYNFAAAGTSFGKFYEGGTGTISGAFRVDAVIDSIKAETALIVADTNELQTDDYPTSIAAIKAETALIVADTNELQTDDIPGTLTTIAGYIDTEIAAIEADTQDIQSRLPAALSGGNIKADALAISGSTDAADRLEASAETIIPATVNDAGATTTVFITDLTSAVDDFYNGRVIIFTDGALAFQATSISDYDGGTKAVTVVALTNAPANGVGFCVV